MNERTSLLLVAALVAASVTAATAGGQLPKMPGELTLPQGDGSPGNVVFSHVSHVDQTRPDCTVCHPRRFRMLVARLKTGVETVTHDKMEKGQQCGVCHNGKAAHGLDDCTSCHRQ